MALVLVAIVLDAGDSQAGHAAAIDGTLPARKFLKAQRIALTGFLQAEKTPAHGGDDLGLSADNPATGVGWWQIGNRQGAAIGTDDIFNSRAYHFGHWTLYTNSRPYAGHFRGVPLKNT